MNASLRLLLPLLLCAAVSAQEKPPSRAAPAVPAPDSLVADGIPPIPADLAEQVGRYTNVRVALMQAWHPTRREMLIRTRFGDTWQLHRVRFPGGDRSQVTFFPDNVMGGATFQPTRGDYFVVRKDAAGDEHYQNYRYDVNTGDVTLLTDGKSINHLGEWSHRGDRMAYASTRRNGKDYDLYAVNPTDPKSDRMIAQFEGSWGVLDWSPDDKKVLMQHYVSVTESYLWIVDVATGNKTEVTPKGPEPVYYDSTSHFSDDGKGLYVVTDRDSEFRRLAYIDLETGKHTYLTTRVKWGVEDFAPSPDGRNLAFVTNEDGVSVLHLMNPHTGEYHAAAGIPKGVISELQWHRNGRDLAFNLATARTATDVFSLDVVTGKLDRWTTSETGGLDTSRFPEPELVRWLSFDGRQISGYLYSPPRKFTGKRPVVIDIHGGPEGQSRPTFLARYNYPITELGVAYLFPNVRGSSGYGKTFLSLDNAEKREDAYKDIGSLLDWIKGRPELDADRVMVTGGSYGGHMTLVAATRYSSRIRCALDVVGMSNLSTFLQRTGSFRQDNRRAEYGDERDPKVREFMERTAPLNHVSEVTKPLFVVQGANDPRVPRSEAEQMVAAVKKNGTPVWYLLGKDEGHGFRKRANQDYQFYAMVLFMQRYLLDAK